MGKPSRDTQLSLSSAHNADRAAGIPPNHWCYRFFELIYSSFDNAQFAHLYEDGGRVPISPTLLACVTILQYSFKVSDRAAVENTIMRRDWRIALGRDDSWAGFDASVLCNFRKRLIEQGCEELIFGHVLEQLRLLGLLANRRKVRVDATSLVANVARLSRGDMIAETLRVAVCELWDACPELRGDAELARLYDEYGEEVWLGREDAGERRLTRLGRDGFVLLELFELVERPRPRTVECRDLLARVLEENYRRGEDDDPRPLAGDELGKDRIATPHEPDVRVGTKKHRSWTGDKVHLVETADEDQPNFVVDVLVTEPTVPDVKVTEAVIERAQEVLPEVEVLLADSGYASAENSRKASERGMDLVSPPLANTRTEDIFPPERFEIDFAARTASCPAGQTTARWYPGERGIRIRFRRSVCAACPLRSQCTTAKQDGRSLHISAYYEQLMRDRARAETTDFRKLYRQRAAVEGTISQAVRHCGLRVSRYRGRLKRKFHALMSGTGVNVRRWVLPAPCTTGARAGA